MSTRQHQHDPRKQAFFDAVLPSHLTPIESASAYAPSNIALSKYWGKRDIELNLPTNGSLSISLAHLGTKTHISLSQDDQDHVYLNGLEQPRHESFARKIIAFCQLWRRKQSLPLVIRTTNTIPTAAGLASSASGFAALTLALNEFFHLALPQQTLSAIARIGSGSAARSLWHGFVRWNKGQQADGRDSIAYSIKTNWPDFRIGLLEVDIKRKKVSSTDGMTHTATTSPLFSLWPSQAEQDLVTIEQAIMAQDFPTLGQTTEANALAMHATMLAARPFLSYFQPQTLSYLNQVACLRQDGIEVYATIDAGPNVKILFLAKDTNAIEQTLKPSFVIAPFEYDCA